MKRFDIWNRSKKSIDSNGTNKYYHPRDIWWCCLGLNVGYEQDGTGKDYERPVLILKGYNKHVCLIIPLTTSLKKSKYLVPLGRVDSKDAQAIISQLRLIDTKRLTNKIGVLDKRIFETIRKTVREQL